LSPNQVWSIEVRQWHFGETMFRRHCIASRPMLASERLLNGCTRQIHRLAKDAVIGNAGTRCWPKHVENHSSLT
jgi:hypothetical protein